MTADEIIKKSAKEWTAEEAAIVLAALDELMAESRATSSECRKIAEAMRDRRDDDSGADWLRELLAADEAKQATRRAYLRATAEYLDLV